MLSCEFTYLPDIMMTLLLPTLCSMSEQEYKKLWLYICKAEELKVEIETLCTLLVISSRKLEEITKVASHLFWCNIPHYPGTQKFKL